MSQRNEHPKKKILVVGAGSVGKRHATNLSKLGYRVDCVDPDPTRRKEFSTIFKSSRSFSELSQGLTRGDNYVGCVISSPPKFHVEQSVYALKQEVPVLLEKPIGKSLDEAKYLQSVESEANKTMPTALLLGYTWRWWNALRFLRDKILAKTIGHRYFARIHVSAHLADWHPWERYQDFFMASKELGGGALLDESHWIDQMIWIFGMPSTVYGLNQKTSKLEITSDDIVEIIAQYSDGFIVSIHLDILGRPHEKSIKIVGSEGTIIWSEENNEVGVSLVNSDTKKIFSDERNDMFVRLAMEFSDSLEGNVASTCSIDDGINVMKVVEAVRESTETGKVVRL